MIEMTDERLEQIRAAAGYEFNPGTIALSAAWELIAEVDRLRAKVVEMEAKVAGKENDFLKMLGASATEYVRAEKAEAALRDLGEMPT